MAATIEQIERAYTHMINAQNAAILAVSNFIDSDPELCALADRVRDAERDQVEMYVAKANKNAPVDVGDEFRISIWDSFRGRTITQLMVDRATAKKKARKLLQHYHPDRSTGNAEIFNIVRHAVRDADIELIHFWGLRTFATPETHPDELLTRIQVRATMAEGHPLFGLASLYYSGNQDRLKTELVNKLNQRLTAVVATNLGA